MSERPACGCGAMRPTPSVSCGLHFAIFRGKRFRRQHPIGRHVVDFACPAHKLAIEIDGGQHAMHEPADVVRTAEIARRGYRVVRFWNNEVVQNLPGVLQAIRQELDARTNPLRPSGGRGQGPAQRGRVRWAAGDSRAGIPHLTPALSAPEGGEGEDRRR